MVHPIMRETYEVSSSQSPVADIVAYVSALLDNLHAVVIGPGLGRDKLMQSTVTEIIKSAREKNVPLVIDADALWLLQQQPDLIKGYKECVLTPNVVEFGRLAKALGLGQEEGLDTGKAGCQRMAQALGGVSIVRKGQVDWVCNGEQALESDLEGGRKRSGGQGDTLTGSIGTLLAWRAAYHEGLWDTEGSLDRKETLMLAAWGGSAITRECSRLAFKRHGRAMQASDLTEEVPVSFQKLIGEKEESKL